MRELQFLLLQARTRDDPCRAEERSTFAAKLGFRLDQVVCHDLLEGPPRIEDVCRYDALLMGGSGEFYVSKRNLPYFDRLLELLAEVAHLGHPTFASCFGFQCLVQALGGKIVYDRESTQVGTYGLTLTSRGLEDPLLGGLPRGFLGQFGRKDRASRLPEGIPNLVTSAEAPYMAFRVPDQPIWAFQFHPELDVETNRQRFLRYRDGYAQVMSEEEFERILADRFRESPETLQLLPSFVREVFGEQLKRKRA